MGEVLTGDVEGIYVFDITGMHLFIKRKTCLLSLVLLLAVSCGQPTSWPYLEHQGKDFTFKNNISFTCVKGFLLQGPDKLKCLWNGSWSANIPRCLAVHCPQPLVPNNTVVIGLNDTYNGSVRYRCAVGYRSTGNIVMARRCSTDGKWTPEVKQECYSKSFVWACMRTCVRVYVCVCVCVCVKERRKIELTVWGKNAHCPRRDSNLYLWDTRP